MKKAFVATLLIIIILCLFSMPVMAVGVKYDFSKYTLEELHDLHDALHAELLKRSGNKEPVSVVSCSLSEQSSKYYTVDFTIKNNLEVPINTITLTVVFTDKDGNTVNATYPQESQRLRPGKTEIIDALCEIALQPKGVFVDKISFSDEQGKYYSFYLEKPEEFYIF